MTAEGLVGPSSTPTDSTTVVEVCATTENGSIIATVTSWRAHRRADRLGAIVRSRGRTGPHPTPTDQAARFSLAKSQFTRLSSTTSRNLARALR